MYCPKCKNEYLCGCGSCAPRHAAAGKICSKPDGDYDTCGYCGLRMHCDAWLDECGRQYDEEKRKENEEILRKAVPG